MSNENELQLVVIQGRGFPADNASVAIRTDFNKQQFKTKVVKKTKDPVFNDSFTFYTLGAKGKIVLKVLGRKKRAAKKRAFGCVTLDLTCMATTNEIEKFYTLKPDDESKAKSVDGPLGELRVKLAFPNRKAPSKAEPKASSGTQDANPKKVTEVYEFLGILGKGGFSVVKEGKDRKTGQRVAIKILNKKTEGVSEELQNLDREISIMKRLRHKNIINLIDVFNENDSLYLVMEVVKGGELFDEIVRRGSYSEKDAANIIRQILEAVSYMHKMGVAHRDLKPENLLIEGDSVKLSDFGLSKRFDNAQLRTCCGTPDYAAPEVLSLAPYDAGVDIWSIGVITYILLCGYPPFYGDTNQEIFKKIMARDFDYPSPDWDDISENAKQFINSLLILDPSARPTAAQCLAAPWIQGNAPARALKRIESFRTQMAKYNSERSKTRR